MSGEPEHDVLVVGGGPTGLTLAAQLQRYGAKVRVVDRQLDRVRESRALAIQPRTLEVLAPLGVSDELLDAGNPAVELRLHAGRSVRRVRLFDLGLDDTAYPYLLFVSQAETERVLGERLARGGVRFERGVELQAMTSSGEVVACVLRHADGRIEHVTARYVVGCDGAHSTVRGQAGIPFIGRAYPQTFVLADLEVDGIEPGAAHAFVSDAGLLFFFPLGSPATWRMLAMRPRTDTTPVERPVALDEVQALADAYAPVPLRVHHPVWMTNFRLHNRGAARYRSGRVFLAGDAAHIHSPAGAQGMNTGIQDSVNLGWKLAFVTAGIGRPELLDTYELERAPVGRTVLRLTDRVFTIATSRNPVVRFGRAHLVPWVLPITTAFKAGRAYAFRTLSQLAVQYRRSPLSVNAQDAASRAPRAGDRLPDAPVIYGRKPGTLHGALVASGFHLLLCGPAAAWPADAFPGAAGQPITVHRLRRGAADAGGLVDHTGMALDRLGLTGDETAHLLVRPDGYVAYRGGADLTGLRQYLAHWLTQPR